MARKFKWDMWNFDWDGSAYIIAKDECPCREDVPAYIVKEDRLSPDVLNPDLGENLCPEIVQDGWCKFQVRSDWENYEGRSGGYVVIVQKDHPRNMYGKKIPGWFPVWIIRLGEWY